MSKVNNFVLRRKINRIIINLEKRGGNKICQGSPLRLLVEVMSAMHKSVGRQQPVGPTKGNLQRPIVKTSNGANNSIIKCAKIESHACITSRAGRLWFVLPSFIIDPTAPNTVSPWTWELFFVWSVRHHRTIPLACPLPISMTAGWFNYSSIYSSSPSITSSIYIDD